MTTQNMGVWRQTKIICGVICLIGAGISALVHADSYRTAVIQPEQWLIERVDRAQLLPEDGRVSISNDFGNIRVRATSTSKVTIHAVVQRHRKDSQLPEVTLHLRDQVLTATVDYPAGQAEKDSLDEWLARRRVDLAAFIPATAPLEIRTKDGLAESKGHGSSLSVRTDTGRIHIVTAGTVDARSTHGDILAIFKNPELSGPSEFQSEDGQIQVYLIESPDIAVSVSTAGDITTEYSIDIRHFPGTRHKEGLITIGSASPRLSLKSQNGDIKVGRLVSMIRGSKK